MRGPTLRLVCVNDVYALDNLPRLRSLVARCATVDPADGFVTTLAGDFVAPSLLSSLDHGAGMVDCLNAVPITHVCFGNHEQDVPPEELAARARQFRGTWLNTNVPGYEPALPASEVLTLRAPGGRAVRVGLLGVVTEDPTLYRPGPFEGRPILPANDTALSTARALVDAGCACVVALTHQSIARDRELARRQGDPAIPLVVGGHEHEPYVEQVGSAWIVKAGTDALYAAVVDLAWPAMPPAAGPDLPSVTVRLEPLHDSPEDPALRALVDRHMAPVRALHAAILLRLAPGVSLSSAGTRVAQTSVGTLVASRVRDALGADACLINGGGIRANRTYTGVFTYGDLEAELPFANEVVLVSMPGRVVREAVAASRAAAPQPSAGFLQVDDRVEVDAAGRVTALAGAPLDEAREYRVATVRVLFDGMDHVEPLVRFARAEPTRVPPRDSGRELKMLVVEAFALAQWRAAGGFERCDVDGDERVSPADLRALLAGPAGEAAPDLLVDGIFRALDANRDGVITAEEARAHSLG